MGRKVKQLKNYTSEQIKLLMESKREYRIAIRLCVVYQLSKGRSSREPENMYNISFKQICTRADRFDAEGIEGLRDKPRSGRPPQLSADRQYDLQSDLLKSPEDFGYNTANRSGPPVRDFIKQKYNVDYKLSNIYNLFHALGFSFQRTGGVYPERDEKRREEVGNDIKKR
jgi:transposase